MGCSQSKMENEEALASCKDRNYFMKQAVSARNAFAAAHSSYATYLKNAGAALTDFAQGEVQNLQFPPPSSAAVQPSHDIPLPPPPLPDFPATLRRAVTVPGITSTRPEPDPVETIVEEAEEEEDDVEEEGGAPPSKDYVYRVRQEEQNDPALEYLFPSVENVPGTTLNITGEVERRRPNEERNVCERSEREGEAAAVASASAPKKGKSGVKQSESEGVSAVSLLQVLTEVDNHFLKASEAAREVSIMLQATRLHYHSNFALNTGHIDYSARVMRVVTWNPSFRGIPNMDDAKDDFDSEERETLATVLDKLLAWEKKLYNEVKAAELTKSEYQRKVANLNKLKKRGTNSEALEKAKAAASHLHTMCIVDMQSLESTVSEINRLRDQQLYPRLVQLVDGMATMWGVMQAHHEQQSSIVMLLRSLDTSQSPTETSEHHHDRTYQLLIVVQEWQSQFEKLINNQKGYIKALYSWLKLNLIPIESNNIKEEISSPPRVKSPPIQSLLHAWHDHLEKLPDELARSAIANFAAVVDTIFQQQEEEMVLKRKCEETRKEHARKSRQFEQWEHKYKQKKRPDEFDPNRAEGDNDPDEVVREKRLLVELVKRLDEEEEAYKRQCQQGRQRSLGSLQNHLPELFRDMSDFSLECSKMYRELRSISQKLSSGQSSS